MPTLIYHIEDNIGDQIIVKHYLSAIHRWDINLQSYKTLKTALVEIEKNYPDLVLLDLSLPDTKDLEGLKKLLSTHPQLCVVVLTGNTKDDLGFDAIKLGAQDFLVKSDLNVEILEKSLGFSLERFRLQKENSSLKKNLYLNKSRLHNLDELNFAYVIRTDLEGKYTYANKYFKDTFVAKNTEIIGTNSLAHIHPDDHNITYDAVNRALSNFGDVVSVKLRKPSLIPGIIKSTLWDFVVLTDSKGEPIELQCTGFDITEKEERQLEFLRIKKENELLLKNSSSLSLILAENFVVEYQIGDTQDLFLENQSLVGHSIEEVLYPPDRIKWQKFITDIHSNLNSSLQIRISNSKGNLIWVLITLNAIQPSLVKRYSLFIKNINKEKLNDISLKYNEAKYRALFEKNPGIILTADLHSGEIIEVNHAFEAKLLFKAHDCVGKKVSELKIWPNEAEHQMFLKQLANKGEYKILKTNLFKSNGLPLKVNLHGTIINLNNQLLKIIIAEDISLETDLGEQLKNQEAIYRALVQNSNTLYLVLNEGLKIVFCSRQAQELGYQDNEILEHYLTEYVNTESLDNLERTCYSVWRDKTETIVEIPIIKFITKAGQTRWYSGLISYLKHFPELNSGAIVCYFKNISTEYHLERERNILHQQTLEALKDLEDYKRILDKHSLVSIIDLKGNFLFVNEFFASTNGYKTTELLGKSTHILYSGYHSNKFYKNLWETIEGGNIWQGEIKNRKKDGSFYWVKTSIAPRIDPESKEILNYISIQTDISTLKETQSELESNRINLRNTLNSISHEIWSIDKSFNLRVLNKVFQNNFQKQFGIKLQTGQNILQLKNFPKEIIENFQNRYEKAFQNEVCTYYDTYVNPQTKETKFMQVTVLPFENKNGVIDGATIYSQDITEQKKYENELKELLLRFELATKSNHIGIWDLNIPSNKLHWDENMFKIYNKKYQEAPLAWEDWSKSLTKDSYESTLHYFNRVINSTESDFNTIFKIKNTNSSPRVISALAKVFRNEKGEAVRLVGLNWDITETAQNQEALKKSLAEIENILNSINDGFLLLNDDLLVEEVNFSACQILSLKKADVIGTNLWKDQKIRDNSIFYPVIKKAKDFKTIERVIGQDQSSKNWVDATIYPRNNGLAIFFKDITIEKERAADLEKLRNNQSALINTTLDLIWSLNPNLELITFNDQFQKHQLNISAEMPSPGNSVFNKHSDQHILDWTSRYSKALAGEVFQDNINENGKDYLLALYPIRNGNNEIEGIACYARDITEKETYLRTIEKQNNELKNIAWMQSHIVRAPVARIMGLIELIEEEKLVHNHDLHGYLQSIDMSAKELDEIIAKITEKTYTANIKGI